MRSAERNLELTRRLYAPFYDYDSEMEEAWAAYERGETDQEPDEGGMY